MEANINSRTPILLHVCCAPCSTWPIEQLAADYRITAFFHNPNIYPPDEYAFRLQETKTYLEPRGIEVVAPEYDRTSWLTRVQRMAGEPEGGLRCRECFAERLERTALTAVERGIPVFTTTLTIGPNKPGKIIFPIGHHIAQMYGIVFLAMDFKKADGFRRSCILSRQSGMYRQDYCGCEYSLRDRNIRKSLQGKSIM
ncbi:epoxyqueuosine reductase QueH [bacterium]|nr:epoxyqueuosine reductase QueH [candidate division CSSED10-310 bacterium]